MGVWVNYEVLRRTLDQELGTMELDSEGLWIDPGPIRMDTLGGEFSPQALMLEQALPVNLPEQASLEQTNTQTNEALGTGTSLNASEQAVPPVQPSGVTYTGLGSAGVGSAATGGSPSNQTIIQVQPTPSGRDYGNVNPLGTLYPTVNQGMPLIPRPQEPIGIKP
jgi:hypothetical protein